MKARLLARIKEEVNRPAEASERFYGVYEMKDIVEAQQMLGREEAKFINDFIEMLQIRIHRSKGALI
jgi:hypothetical protein